MTSDRSSDCLEQETLVALIAGDLRLDQHPDIEAHLAECSACQNVVAAAASALEDSRDEGLAERDALPQPGELIAGKYRIERVLGRGGMGTVFAARHGELGQIVAIKVLHSAAPTAELRFQREAKISAQLCSEHTARVFDLGTTAGAPFLVMEYLAGEDLSRVIARGRVEPSLAVRYALEICEALVEAHAGGIVHRDLKPSNVFLVRRTDGSASIKVLDFGISKRISAENVEPSHDLTSARVVLGSPAYMSPEQLRHSKNVDARSDLWSLGVVLYELLTGLRPFQAGSLSALSAAIAADTPPSPAALEPSVPGALERVVMRCLKKDPEDRFASAADVADALRAALPKIRRAPASAPRRAPRRRWLVALTLGPVAIAGLLLQLAARRAEVREIAPVRPRPSAEPAARPALATRLAVHCDTSLPSAELRAHAPASQSSPALDRRWPLQAICDSEEHAPALLELGGALARSFPQITLELVPAHPCYLVDVRSDVEGLRLDVARGERCSVPLTLTGAGCDRITSLEIGVEGSPHPLVAAPAPRPIAGATPPSCQTLVELPFAAFGQRLRFRMEPRTFGAASVQLSGAALQVPLVTQQRHAPAQSARPKACVPPDYCRY